MAGTIVKNALPTLNLRSYLDACLSLSDPKPSPLRARRTGMFELLRMQEGMTTCQQSTLPHRIDFYLIVLIKGGSGLYTGGATEYRLSKDTMCFVGPYQLTSWRCQTEEQDGYCISFSEDFFTFGLEDKQALKRLPFFGVASNMVLNLSPAQAGYYDSLMQEMETELQRGGGAHSEDLVRALLHLLVKRAEAGFAAREESAPGEGRARGFARGDRDHNPADEADNNPVQADHRLTRTFFDCCRDQLALLATGKIEKMASLAEMAARLHVTQNYLNDTVRKVSGRSAGAYIRELLTTEASALLRQTGLSVSEIAYRLGFNDPSYFARFYRRQTGMSPRAVKEGAGALRQD